MRSVNLGAQHRLYFPVEMVLMVKALVTFETDMVDLQVDEQRAHQEQDDDDRQQPKLFPFLHEGPQFHDKLAHSHLRCQTI